MTTRAFLCLATFFVNLDNLWGFFTRGWIIDGPRKHLGNETFGLFQNTVSVVSIFQKCEFNDIWRLPFWQSVYWVVKMSEELACLCTLLVIKDVMSGGDNEQKTWHDKWATTLFRPHYCARPTFDVVANCPSDFWIMMMIIIIAIWAVTENVAVTPNQNEIWESGRERNIHFEK